MECDRCGDDEELIACYHYETMKVLANICQACVDEWIESGLNTIVPD